jgi:hypothetical protein
LKYEQARLLEEKVMLQKLKVTSYAFIYFFVFMVGFSSALPVTPDSDSIACPSGSYYDEVSKVCVPEELCDVVTKSGKIIAASLCKLIQIRKDS